MMTKLYCPECGAYLEGGDGENKDCHCGWKQPVPVLHCDSCGNHSPEYVNTCQYCGSDKCDVCDAGDDVGCNECEEDDDEIE
ncbi:hypothetical protein NLN92_18935 [Citrobacter portucalensis]|uniref:hypothetical protein n=1 Tax=Citrobacter portucalensis TaxID=1639133 RepID=UPI00226B742D|nr:hypothetical protein [Citrobacter portucalensis]MCX8980082.1 hypothetical protein [Citrobacter portucalensis]